MKSNLTIERTFVGQVIAVRHVENIVEEAILVVPRADPVGAEMVDGIGDVEEVLPEFTGASLPDLESCPEHGLLSSLTADEYTAVSCTVMPDGVLKSLFNQVLEGGTPDVYEADDATKGLTWEVTMNC